MTEHDIVLMIQRQRAALVAERDALREQVAALVEERNALQAENQKMQAGLIAWIDTSNKASNIIKEQYAEIARLTKGQCTTERGHTFVWGSLTSSEANEPTPDYAVCIICGRRFGDINA